ncbi:AI-2E family transporter, partial [Patescibacteria group bacterium]
FQKSVGSLILEKLPGVFLIACLLAALVALFYLLRPFLTSILLGAVLTILFYPFYRKMLKWLRGWERLASLLTCLIVIMVIVLPVTGFTILLASEGLDTYNVIQDKFESGVFDEYMQWEDGGFFYDIKEEVKPVVNIDELNIKDMVFDVAQRVSDFLTDFVVVLVETFSTFVISLMVLLFSMYYFFKDGDIIIKRFGKWSPLPSVYEKELFEKIVAMVNAIMFGVFLSAIVQGLIGGIGFAIAGISNSIFWGTAMAFFSIVPLVGTAIIWAPAVIILLILGNFYAAIFILIWGILAVGSSDNILRTYLIGGKAHTYPLITFLVVLGGIWVMGLKGVIVGPLVLMILMSFLHIYEVEYGRVLKK